MATPEYFEVPFSTRPLVASFYGSGDRTILLLHGAGQSTADSLLPLREDLDQRGFRTLAFDHIGHGRTGGELSETSLKGKVEEAISVVEHANIEGEIGVIGMSMGCYIAARLTEHVPVSGLTIFAPAAYATQAYTIPFGPDFTQTIRQPESWRQSSAWPTLKKFEGSLLVVAGGQEPVIPADIPTLYYNSASNAKSRQLEVLPDIGHFILSELRNKQDPRLDKLLDVTADMCQS